MLGALISAGAALAGNLLNQRSQKKANQTNIELANTSVQRRVEDARKAGISPLFALGANVQSPSVSSVGAGEGLASMGQNIGRAVDAESSPVQRAGGLAADLARAQLQGVQIDNEIKKQELLSKVALRTQAGTGPAVLDSDTTPMIAGQGNAKIKLEKRMSPAGYLPQKSFSVSPEIDMYRTVQGFSPEVPQDLGEAHESQPLAAAQWFLRNKLAPHFSESWRTYPYSAPSDSYWTFDPLFGQYVLVKKGGNFNNRANKWEHLMERFRQ